MRRKIAAMISHIAGYGRLVADDEEETLRRMASYRSTTDDLIAIAGGRIFNAAGDASTGSCLPCGDVGRWP